MFAISPRHLAVLLLFLGVGTSHAADQRGLSLLAQKDDIIGRFAGYHALVAGVGTYPHWDDLRNAVEDAEEVAAILKDLDFQVELSGNPTAAELRNALKQMVFGPGDKEDHALLFYFSGHGMTLEQADGNSLGYIIPADCPLMSQDRIGFDDSAISMNEIKQLCLNAKSRHIIMVFDSCFSGSIFNRFKAAPDVSTRDPSTIRDKLSRKVRQFITAGDAGEPVPDQSIFQEVFLDGIAGGCDFNHDGYVTGSELGMHLQNEVVNYTGSGQHPQYGTINNPKLDKGDFVFFLDRSHVPQTPSRNSRLTIKANVDSAAVYVDGRKVGITPLYDLPCAAGNHPLTVEKDGYEPVHDIVEMDAGWSTVLSVHLNRPPIPGDWDIGGGSKEPPVQSLILDGVSFESGSAKLAPVSWSVLRRVAESLLANPDVMVEVQGHTDSVGRADLNRSLSLHRAHAVRDALITLGVESHRMTAIGYGEDYPVAHNETAEGRAKNRRIEIHRSNR